MCLHLYSANLQLLCIADYIVEEAVKQDDTKEAVDKMNLRLSLLAPHADQNTLSALIAHLNTNAAKATGSVMTTFYAFNHIGWDKCIVTFFRTTKPHFSIQSIKINSKHICMVFTLNRMSNMCMFGFFDMTLNLN